MTTDKILVVAAHPDDLELAIGGMFTRMKNVMVYIASDSITINQNYDMIKETKSSICDIYDANLQMGKFETMHLWDKFQELRDVIFELKKLYNPTTIYCTSPKSTHPDHSAVGYACRSIFLEQTIYTFEPTRSNQDFTPNRYVPITKEELQTKLKACSCYTSQAEKHYFDPEALIASARHYGSHVGVEFAEALEVLWQIG